jgi:hypothetical protein
MASNISAFNAQMNYELQPLTPLPSFPNYSMDDRGSITGTRKFLSSSLCVQTSSKAHPASYPMGAGVKRGRGVTLTTHPI